MHDVIYYDLKCDNIRIPQIQGYGSARIETYPPGAKVFIDNVEQPLTTPLVINSITSGIHDYRLSIPGFAQIYGAMSIIEGQEYTLYTRLTQVPSTTDGSILIPLGLLGLLSLLSRREKRIITNTTEMTERIP